ncbi:MAG: peptidoglycan DD-metalloendopeptidase family protein [Chloroflexi bacterium]|nr:peptidoglycan DD-metalloendopeptidase family protein [Chloroflexota bacterium]
MSSSAPDFFLINPVSRSFLLTSRFNAPRNYTFAPDKLQLHEGVDIAALDAQGRPVAVLAAQRGIVDKIGFSASGYGNYVRVVHDWHDGRWVTWYGHLSQVTVKAGQFVRAGQKLGIAGTTGFSSGVHLHLTLQRIGRGLDNYTVDEVVDPAPYFRLDAPVEFDEAMYVADLTVADGMLMQPGQVFEKIWRVRNTGTTIWDAGYRLVFADGNKLGGPDHIPLPRVPVEPGQVIDLGARLIAPTVAGRYRSEWRLCNPAGQLCEGPISVEIEIKITVPYDEASYVADITIEDGTVIQPGERFVKTWRVRNSGTTTWDESYGLRFCSDDRMGGPESVTLPHAAAPGETVEVSVPLVAPASPGRHRSTWKLANGQGHIFEYDLYAEIQVPVKATPTEGLNEARWVADVTVPDGMQMQPGERFIKTWRVRNSGTTTWDAGYTLAFFGDDRMDGPDNVPLPPARPGETVEVSIPLVAPGHPGMHRSTWKPRDPQGRFFEFDLFALIEVVDPLQATRQLNELSWVADVTVPDGTDLLPGERFVKTWRMRNTGTTAWSSGYTLAFFGDDRMGGPDSVPLPPLKPGEMADISIELTAPTTPGQHKSTWKGRDLRGKFFEYDLFALIDVVTPGQTVEMLDYLQGDGRLVELAYDWDGGGRVLAQTQTQGGRIYHVKDSEWEEFWADDHFIYRGVDTTAEDGVVRVLTEMGQYGSAWLPRRMTPGIPFRHVPITVFYRKDSGQRVRHMPQVKWVQLEAVHPRYQFPGGIALADVASVAVYADANGQPAAEPDARYLYARQYGLVGWEGSRGTLSMVGEFAPGERPDNERELLPWLDALR